MFITKSKLNKMLNAAECKAYKEGYKKGFAAGEESAFLKKQIENEIRAMFVLPPF